MRIGVDARPLAAPATGIGRYTRCLLSEMVARGHEWCLYSDCALQTDFSDYANVTVRSGISRPSSLSGIYYSQGIYRSWIKKDTLDLFWSPRHHLPWRLNGRMLQVVTIHDTVWKRFPDTMPAPALWLDRMLMPASLEQASAIICVSQFTASEVSHFWPEYADKCVVIPSAAVQMADMPPKKEKQPYILFVGTSEPRKNLHRLLEAFSRLVLNNRIEENLVIAGGSGWGKVDLASLAVGLNIQDRVFLKGQVEDEQLSQLYRGARCLVLPSLYEGFGLPVLEAMQFGVPVVVSETGSLREITGPAGLFVDPMSEDSIAQAIEILMKDEDLYARLSILAKKRSTEFSWQKAAGELLAVFENVSR